MTNEYRYSLRSYCKILSLFWDTSKSCFLENCSSLIYNLCVSSDFSIFTRSLYDYEWWWITFNNLFVVINKRQCEIITSLPWTLIGNKEIWRIIEVKLNCIGSNVWSIKCWVVLKSIVDERGSVSIIINCSSWWLGRVV